MDIKPATSYKALYLTQPGAIEKKEDPTDVYKGKWMNILVVTDICNM